MNVSNNLYGLFVHGENVNIIRFSILFHLSFFYINVRRTVEISLMLDLKRKKMFFFVSKQTKDCLHKKNDIREFEKQKDNIDL